MSMRSALPYLLALVLGASTAVLAACGSGSSSDRKQFIPQRSADRLSSALSDVRSAVDDGNCEDAARAIVRARSVLVNLPSAVSDRLVARLRQGIDNLEKVAPDECKQNQTTTQQTTTQETTTQQTTTTTPTTPTTATTDTTTTPTTTTTTPTTSTGTTTQPPATTTTAPADTTGTTTP